MKRQTRFISRKPAKVITSSIEAVAESMGLKVNSRNFKVDACSFILSTKSENFWKISANSDIFILVLATELYFLADETGRSFLKQDEYVCHCLGGNLTF